MSLKLKASGLNNDEDLSMLKGMYVYTVLHVNVYIAINFFWQHQVILTSKMNANSIF